MNIHDLLSRKGVLGAALWLWCLSGSAQELSPKPAARKGSYSFVTAQVAAGAAADQVIVKQRPREDLLNKKTTPAQLDSLVKVGAAERLPNGALVMRKSARVPVPEEEVKAREEAWKRYRQSWVRKPVPDVSFLDRNGTVYRLPELAGKVVVLSFWYGNCHPCLKDRPMLEEVASRFRPNPEVPEVLFLMPAVDDLPPHSAPSRLVFLPKSGKQARDVFHVSWWPTTFLIDKKGTIRTVVMGSHSGTVEQLSNAIQRMLLE
ncbi:TlpA family protein disulfide reductase [Rufibacter psychrotolerans]|uniref:TlpA family protein disulfide reductase n=1 Tax=Rufibacter psychrotolerans TaxID=2812556 RepID=UPI0019670DA5|nr:TlpA disulfide reductase family protein [Rufibacter sp. SYSU D00308]